LAMNQDNVLEWTDVSVV